VTDQPFNPAFVDLFGSNEVSKQSTQGGNAPPPLIPNRGADARPSVGASPSPDGRTFVAPRLPRRFFFGISDPAAEAVFFNKLRRRLDLRPNYDATIDVKDLERGVFFRVTAERAVDLYNEQDFFKLCRGCRLPSGHLRPCGEAVISQASIHASEKYKAKKAAR
jgi:hypothetical protein